MDMFFDVGIGAYLFFSKNRKGIVLLQAAYMVSLQKLDGFFVDLARLPAPSPAYQCAVQTLADFVHTSTC